MKFKFELDAFDVEFFDDIFQNHQQRCMMSLMKCCTKPDEGYYKGISKSHIDSELSNLERVRGLIYAVPLEVVSTTRVDDYPDVDINVYKYSFELDSADIVFVRKLIDNMRTKYLQLVISTFYDEPDLDALWKTEGVRPHYKFSLERVDNIDTLMFGEIDHVLRGIFGTEV